MNDRKDALLAVYNQHLEHARHVENLRSWFGNVFAGIVAGSLALVKASLFDQSNIPLLLFLVALSLFGAVLSIRLHLIFKSHIVSAYDVCGDLGVERRQYEPRYVLGRARKISVWRLFPTFYVSCGAFFFWSICYSLVKSVVLSLPPCVGLWCLFVFGLWRWKPRFPATP